MDTVTVALAWPLDEELTQRIRDVSPRLRVVQITDMAIDENKLLRQSPGSEEQRRATAELDETLREAEVLLSAYRPPANIPARTPKLGWVQVIGAGVERVLGEGPLGHGIALTNARGVGARPIAEWVLGAMLMFAKHMPHWERRRAARQYDRLGQRPSSLQGKTVGILGMGAIGTEVAKLARAFDMRVLATRRRSPGSSGSSAAPQLPAGLRWSASSHQGESPSDDVADEVRPASDTNKVIANSDYVVIALPHTKETHHAIGREQIAAMKPTAYLLNVGRGPIVDEAALVEALRERRIAGAGLDVFEREPLPPESPIWDLDNVVFSPHISGAIDDMDRRMVDLFAENLRRYLSGEPLLNVVDQEAGY